MMITARLLVAASALAITAPALAQDMALEPTYGTVSLSAGFPDDPYGVELASGGTIAASDVISGCTGFIANAPDVRLNYDAGSLPLILAVASDADTTLVINGPDGSWYCDDDSGGDLNPEIAFDEPQSGKYDIWVGTYAAAEVHPAELYISEIAGY